MQDRNNQSLKGAVAVTLCQNDGLWLPNLTHRSGKVSQSDFPCLFCGWDIVVNSHVKFYFCLTLAEGRANCSFQYLTEVHLYRRNNVGLLSHWANPDAEKTRQCCYWLRALLLKINNANTRIAFLIADALIAIYREDSQNKKSERHVLPVGIRPVFYKRHNTHLALPCLHHEHVRISGHTRWQNAGQL